MTLIEMLQRNVKLFPEKTAIIHGESRISFKVLYERSNALANFLNGVGLKKGERVGLLLGKSPDAIVSFIGVATAGGIVCPIDYNQSLDYIQSTLDITNPSVVIVSDSLLPVLYKLRLCCPSDKIIVVGQERGESFYSWAEIMAQASPSPSDVIIQDSDVVYLNFTSGTTGFPKGAVTTHANIYWNTLASVESLRLTHEDIHLCMFPVFVHPHELFARALYLGGTIVLIDDTLPISIARAISDHRVTCLMAIALVYQTLVRFRPPAFLDFSSLRIAESGGMPVSTALAQKFEKQFGIPIIPVWGSTETTGIALAAPISDRHKPGSMGKPCTYYKVKIVGEDGKELPSGKIGEMVIKGPAVCSGYFGNSKETEKHMKDGWFFTGDLVKKNSEGYYYFADRKSRMMKVAGLKVFPNEIEGILSAHPKIAEVAVVKAQDQLQGEVPMAAIVLKHGVEINEVDIRKYCGKRMPRYKVPAVIEFMTELPKTQTGKILYRKLQSILELKKEEGALFNGN
jgi:long-chain acyl-CoA synthetase